MPRIVSISFLIAMLLCASIAGWLAMSRSDSFEAEITRLEALPATIKLREKKENGVKEVSLIRLAPAQGDRKRDLGLLSSSVVLKTIKGFDASDCVDFGDQELSYLSDASQIQISTLEEYVSTPFSPTKAC